MKQPAKTPPRLAIVAGIGLLFATPLLAETSAKFRLVRDTFIILPVLLNGSGPFDFMLDTGTTTTTVDISLAEHFCRDDAHQAVERNSRQPLRVSTNQGYQLLMTGWIRRLELSDDTFRNLPVTLLSSEENLEGRQEDGLLPGRLFDSLYVHHRDEFVVFNPRPDG